MNNQSVTPLPPPVTLHIYTCRACGREWEQASFESVWAVCPKCGADAYNTRLETSDYIIFRPDPWTGTLYWSKSSDPNSDPNQWPRSKTCPRWWFAIRHPILYWRLRKGETQMKIESNWPTTAARLTCGRIR